MPAESFVDTDILLYTASTDPRGADKRKRARKMLAGAHWELSVQVLQEQYVNLARPSRRAM